MNSDRTSNNCFWTMEVDGAASKDARTSLDWTREEDKAFEIALFTHYNHADMWDKITLAVPGKTVQDLKLHYEALSLMAFESGKMPLSIYSTKGDVLEEKKLKSEQATRGAHWTEEEHRQFLDGLEKYGKGSWKNISEYCVHTRSSTQVASHAQKYYRRLSSTKKEGKRLSIYDITTLKPEKLLPFEKATASCMPECCKGESSTAGTEELLPGNPEKAAAHTGTQLLPGSAMGASGNASGKRGRPKNASSTDGNKPMMGARYPQKKKALACNESQLLIRPKKAPSDAGKLLLSGCPNEAPKDIGYQLLSGYPNQLGPPSGSLKIAGHPTPSGMVGRRRGAPVQDIDVIADCLLDIGSDTETLDDLDLSLFPHFLD
ncbi:hypothetical protein SASPL_113131 [Salvia splendens]|uniref:Uncharacterized protein n=1 Tax=Salvia splendens TaxID=180675 RepID=A0A8X8XYF0_SALSN|nr:uncharacterized protein LOC121804643 [Salvia splendens]XP_042060207.1 uncharacterized protein LOC121804643 [Salvia splendens]KAG6422751.1 hypothetical protein SASPL_113131 [Salvia splendens]